MGGDAKAREREANGRGRERPLHLPVTLQLRSTLSGAPYAKTHEGSAEKEHGGRLRHVCDVRAADTYLADVLENGTVYPGQGDGRHELIVDRGDGKEVLTVRVDGEVVLEKATVDVDAFDVDDRASIDARIDVEDGTSESVVIREAKGELRKGGVSGASRDGGLT